MTVPGILVVDKFGRRKMLLVGAAAMAVCQFLVAVVGTTRGGLVVDAITGNQVIQDPAAQKVLISFVCLYIAAFAAICEFNTPLLTFLTDWRNFWDHRGTCKRS